jgi:CBS domain containing-hemolysin-like protein
LLDLARRHGANVLLIQNAGRRGFAGYVRTIELSLCQESDPLPTHDLLRLDPSLPVIDALIELQSLEQDLAEVVDASGKPVGLLLADELANVLIPTTR